MPQLAGHPAFWGVYLAVDDVDATAAKVVPAGGKVEAGPFDVMELGRMASIQDPTGARVNLWQAGQSIGSVRVNEPGCPIWHELTQPRPARRPRRSTARCSASSGSRCRWRPATTTPA